MFGTSRCLVVAVLLLTCFTHPSQIDQPEEDDWIDPMDMINFDQSQQRMVKKPTKDSQQKHSTASLQEPVPAKTDIKIEEKTTTTPAPESFKNLDEHLQKAKPNPIVIKKPTNVKGSESTTDISCPSSRGQILLFKQYIRTILRHFKDQKPLASNTEYIARLRVSPGDLDLLQRYCTEQAIDFRDVHEVLTRMMDRVLLADSMEFEHQPAWNDHLLGVSLHKVLMVVSILALSAVILTMEIMLKVSWRKKIIKMLFMLFVISTVWTWYHLYKVEEAKQHTAILKDIPKECLKKDEELKWYEKMSNVLWSSFSVQEDKCVKYYEQLLVDPILRVSPTEALAHTFVRFVLSPVQLVGEAFGKLIKGVLLQLPAHIGPMVLVVSTIVFVLLLFLSFGYRIRVPFFLSIEPGQQREDGTIKALVLENQKMIHDLMKAGENKIMKRLEQLEKPALQQIDSKLNSETKHDDIKRLEYTKEAISAIHDVDNSSHDSTNNSVATSKSQHTDNNATTSECSRIEEVKPSSGKMMEANDMHAKGDNTSAAVDTISFHT